MAFAGDLPSFIAIIPSRRASTRLPDKALAEIAGVPMVVHVARRAAASGAARVLVATDDEGIADAVRSHGFEAIMTSPSHTSGTDRIAEVTRRLALDPEAIVVNVQGDEPLIDPSLIARAATTLSTSTDCAIATACHRIASPADFDDPNVVKVVTDRAGRALYFSRAPIPWPRDAGSASVAFRHIGLYAYRAGFLAVFASLELAPFETTEALEQLRALWHGYRIAVFETVDAPAAGVDTAADLARVRALVAGSKPGI